MAPAPLDISRLAVHQVTINQCGFRESIECLSRHGIRSTAIWRETLEEVGVSEARRILDGEGVGVLSLCPCGFLTHGPGAPVDQVIEQNKRWMDEALALGAGSIVVITGGLPEGSRDLAGARNQAAEGLASLIPLARAAGIKLAFEPLHPMVCGFRSVISSLGEALSLLDRLGAEDVLGVAFDSYALWWEADLAEKIAAAGPRICNVHISDWLPTTRDLRLDRGMPGDGLIDNRQIRGWLEKAGYQGPMEVEILSAENWWRRPADEVLETILQRMEAHL